MVPDITRNIFYWFRGPSGANDAGPNRVQLENNLTKAFISVLEHCDREVVLKAFLRRIGLAPRQSVAFSLQRRPAVADTVKRKVVVGITGGPAEVVERGNAAGSGRPDAWIFSDKWAVLVESKIGRKLSRRQLQAHARSAGWGPRSYRLVLLDWQDIHGVCKSAKDHVAEKDRVSHLLLQDWLAYLEHQSMTEFEKLEEVDFDFMGLPPAERRAMLSHVRARMHSFAEVLATRSAARQIAGFYKKRKAAEWKYSDPNTFGDSYWFNVGDDLSAHTWHATVFYRRDGLTLELLNSQNHLVRQLCGRGIDRFRKIVEMAAHENVWVGCRRAWYRDPRSSYKGQHIAWADQPIMILPSTLDARDRDSYAIILRNALRSMLADRRFRSELNVALAIPRERLVPLPIGKQVMAVAGGLQRLEPILAYLLEQS
jgi:hypothetical protein